MLTSADIERQAPTLDATDESGAKLPWVIRHPGIVLAVFSFCLGIIWASVIRPLDAPDEPAHLQAIMQVRVGHILPEVHYDFTRNPSGDIQTAGDPRVIDYARNAGAVDPFI